MTEHIQGTITLDGLIEGKLGEPESADRLREWTEFVGGLRLRFNLDITGGQFSLLPDDAPTTTVELGDAPERTIADALEQLVAALPEPVRPHVFSTLRSSEYRPGEEVQSIYAVGVDGKVEVQRRVVAAQTVAPPEPIDIKTKVKMVLSGIVVSLAILGIASLFVDFSALWGETVDTMRPLKADEMEIDASGLDGLIALGKDAKIAGRRLELTLMRGPAFPATTAELEAAIAAEKDVKHRLAMEALLRGYVRVELFDDEGAYYAHAELRIKPLFEKDALPTVIPLHTKLRTGRVVLTY